MKKIKKIILLFYTYAVPHKNFSYKYRLFRIKTNLVFWYRTKILKSGTPLASKEIEARNRGDKSVKLDENVVKHQFPLLDRYVDFIDNQLLKSNYSNSILDIGSREGYLLEQLRDRGYKKVRGYEVVKDWVEYCKNRGADYIDYVDLLSIDTNQSKKFDLVFSRHTLEHVDRTALFFEKMKSLIEKDGVLFAVFPLNSKPNYKHPSYLPSVEFVKDNFNFNDLDILYAGRLENFLINNEVVDILDEREEDEVVIYAKKK